MSTRRYYAVDDFGKTFIYDTEDQAHRAYKSFSARMAKHLLDVSEGRKPADAARGAESLAWGECTPRRTGWAPRELAASTPTT